AARASPGLAQPAAGLARLCAGGARHGRGDAPYRLLRGRTLAREPGRARRRAGAALRPEDAMTQPIEDAFSLIAALRKRGEEFCVVTVVRTEHATSAKAGVKAVVLADGTIHGFLGGNCVQGAVRRTAAVVLRDGS